MLGCPIIYINRLSRLKYHFVGNGLKTVFALGRFWPARKIVLCVYANPKEMYCCDEHRLYIFILEILVSIRKYLSLHYHTHPIAKVHTQSSSESKQEYPVLLKLCALISTWKRVKNGFGASADVRQHKKKILCSLLNVLIYCHMCPRQDILTWASG